MGNQISVDRSVWDSAQPARSILPCESGSSYDHDDDNDSHTNSLNSDARSHGGGGDVPSGMLAGAAIVGVGIMWMMARDDSKSKGNNTQHNGPKRWPWGAVPYEINVSSSDLKHMIEGALEEFQRRNLPIRWIPKRAQDKDYVVFVQNNNKNPQSGIGFLPNTGVHTISLPFPNYPNSNYKLKKVCILHECMHRLGFKHIQQRSDRNHHVNFIQPQCATSIDNDTSNTVSFGHYDYYSIMHYGHGAGGVWAKNDELKYYADRSPTFSQCDLAVMRRVYGTKDTHFGIWHNHGHNESNPMKAEAGDVIGVNCGYNGNYAHWTCCMNTKKNSKCHATHHGFWHMKCIGKDCTDKLCSCKACGGGCTYVGYTGHWSCCNKETFNSQCSNSPYNNTVHNCSCYCSINVKLIIVVY